MSLCLVANFKQEMYRSCVDRGVCGRRSRERLRNGPQPAKGNRPPDFEVGLLGEADDGLEVMELPPEPESEWDLPVFLLKALQESKAASTFSQSSAVRNLLRIMLRLLFCLDI